jgi:plasmid replication initiation protein
MQRNTAQSFKVKLDMIRERESMMSERDFKNKDLFPNFLILCKPNSEDRNSDSGNSDFEWNGILKEMEKVVKRQIDASIHLQKK